MKKILLPAFLCAMLMYYADKSNAQANQSLSNLTAPTAVNKDLKPDANNTRDLGGALISWRNIYLSNGLYLSGNLALHASGLSNFFVGSLAGNTSLTGGYNTGMGRTVLRSLTSGSNNTASGFYSMYSNTTGNSNTASGYRSLYRNTSGSNNTATGDSALYSNTTGNNNTASGSHAMYSNTTGYSNTADGKHSLYANTTGAWNTACGYVALRYNTTGNYNTASGANVLYWNTSGNYNTGSGYHALWANSTGLYNTASGANALFWNTTGQWNTASGYNALYKNISADGNTAIGDESLFNNETGAWNTAIGLQSLYFNETGDYNAAIGTLAMTTNRTGNYNTALGSWANVTTSNLTNATAIGYNAGVDASNKVRVGNTSVTSIGGQVGWTTFSDGRYKKDVKENVAGLAFINRLRPISYTVDITRLNEYYNKGRRQLPENKDKRTDAAIANAEAVAGKIVHDGFIAQEVEEAAQQLNFVFSGVDKPQSKDGLYGLRYENFVVPLVKAVQELSKMNDEKNEKIDKQQQQIDGLQKQIDALKKLLLANQNISSAKASANVMLSDASLEQNSPNPFNNTTTINYVLPQKFMHAQIVITDKNGRILKQANITGSGKGSLHVNAAMLSSGAYNYALIIDGKLISSKQMVLTK